MKFVYAILVLLALVVAALFLVPPYLDWERFKPEITERLEALTGRDLAIDGAVAVSLLPTPEITIADLRIANAPGAAAPDLARIKSLDLALALGPLLGGEIAVTSLEMVEPVIELQRLGDGRPNWLLERAAAAPAGGAPEAAALEPARIDSATIRNGVIVYRRSGDRPPERIERIDAELTARSLGGPFRADGSFAVRGRAVAFQLATGTIGDDRTLPLSLDATVGGDSGNALLEGTVSGIDGTPSFAGTVRAQGPDLGAMLAALDLELAAVPATPLANAFSAKGALSANTHEVAVRDIQLRLGESQAGGTLSWQDGDVPLLDAKITLNRIDLDQYLPADGGAGAVPAAGDAEQAAATPALDFLGTVPAHMRQMIPRDIGADLDLSIDALTWRRGVIRQAKAQLAVDGGAVAIQHASALLPGGAKVDLAGRLPAAGDGPWLEGTAEVAADDLRAVLSWLALDTGAVRADRLRRLDASLDFSAQGTRLATSNLDARVDTTRIAGDAFVETGERPRLAARLAADAVNVDAYLLGDGWEGDAQNASQAAEARPGDGVRAALAGMDADVALRMDSLIYGGVRLTGLEFGGTVADGDLTLHRASVADVLGASVSMTGTARAVWTVPVVDVAVEGAADSLSGVAALLEIDPDIRTEPFGAIALQGTATGGEEALTLDLALSAGSAEASLAGTVETPFGTPAAALALNLRASDAAALARAVGLTPPPVVARLGALALDGGIGGDPESVAIDLSADVAGAALRVSGRVADPFASPSYRVVVDLSHPHAEDLLETVAGAAPADAALGPLHVVGSVAGDGTAADIAGIDAAIGPSRVSGGVFLRLDRAPPGFNADLRADTLDLAWLGGGLAAAGDGESGIPAAEAELVEALLEETTAPPARWSTTPLDLGVLDRLDGTLALGADALILGAYRIEQAEADLVAADGTLTLRALGGRLFDGRLEADGSLGGGPAPAGQAAFRLADADMGAILREAAGVDAVSGSATADGYFTLSGRTAHEMVESLTGRVALTARDGTLDDVDLSALSRQIDALGELETLDDIPSFIASAERSLSSGQTAIRSLDGAVRVQDGHARIYGFRIVTDAGVGDIEGSADLPAWQLDLSASFRLSEHPDAPPVGVRLQGPIDRPERHYRIEEMQAHLVRLGLLSLARTPEFPTITIRKGAKAEPGTEMDTLLRDVFGDPEEAEDTGPAEEPLEADDEEQPTAAPVPDEPTPEPPSIEVTPTSDEPASEPPSVEMVPVLDEVAPVSPSIEATPAPDEPAPEPASIEAVPVPDEPAPEPPSIEAAPAPDEPAPLSPSVEVAPTPMSDDSAPDSPLTPERHRGETLQDLVDDVLGETEPSQDADRQGAVDDPSTEPAPQPDANESEPDPDEDFQGFVDDLLRSLDE